MTFLFWLAVWGWGHRRCAGLWSTVLDPTRVSVSAKYSCPRAWPPPRRSAAGGRRPEVQEELALGFRRVWPVPPEAGAQGSHNGGRGRSAPAGRPRADEDRWRLLHEQDPTAETTAQGTEEEEGTRLNNRAGGYNRPCTELPY